MTSEIVRGFVPFGVSGRLSFMLASTHLYNKAFRLLRQMDVEDATQLADFAGNTEQTR
jgi:hypothetical protein